ncbi:MAG: dihydrodipicolinate synthase family protein, partial [Verrucomicrobiota bacterium]
MSIERIEGPVFPIVTPFVDDPHGHYPVDVPALRRYVDYMLDDGAKVLMVASATSRFAQLEESEIRLINDVVVDQTGDRGIPIASTGILGSTRLHVETAQHAEAIGAPVIACEYPWRYQNTEALVAYFQAIADNTESIKIMLHVTPGRSELGGQYRYNVPDLQEILKIPRVIGMKEAAGDSEISKSIWEELS